MAFLARCSANLGARHALPPQAAMRLCADSRVLQDTSMGESMGESLGSVRWTIGVDYRDVLSRCAVSMCCLDVLTRWVQRHCFFVVLAVVQGRWLLTQCFYQRQLTPVIVSAAINSTVKFIE